MKPMSSTFAAFLNLTGVALADVQIEYVVSLPRPQSQLVEVAMHLRGLSDFDTDIALPTWRPGRYIIVDPAGDVRRMRVEDATGQPLQVETTSSSSWRVSHPNSTSISVRYEVFANDLSLRTRHVDDTHAFLSPSSVFLYVPELRDKPARIRVDAPQGWQIATGLPEIAPGVFEASSYDMLVDAPFEIGIHDVTTFEVDGIRHDIVIWGNTDFDRERLRKDFARITEVQRDFFGSLPYDRYVFMLHVQPGLRGGTEHFNSTIMQVGPSAFETPDAYRNLLALTSHELFHTWNIKRFRPAGLAHYDYHDENLTPHLWLVEGSTSYYDDLLLVRAGLMSAEKYCDVLAETIGAYLARPGRNLQSLEDASLRAWIEFNRPSADRENSSVNFYSQGALATFVLDAHIRRRSMGKRSFDDVMRELNARFPLGSSGYTNADIIAAISEAAGADSSAVVERAVGSTDELPLAESLALFGLELDLKPTRTAWEKELEQDPRPTRADLGLRTIAGTVGARVTAALESGPAHAAGIIAGDEIIAINGKRVGGADLSQHLNSLEPGSTVAIAYFRRDELRTVAVRTAQAPNGTWTVRVVPSPSADQQAMLSAWLGAEAASSLLQAAEPE